MPDIPEPELVSLDELEQAVDRLVAPKPASATPLRHY